MARKVFLSVLGTSHYGKCKYSKEETGFISTETRFIQTATLEYIGAKNWNKDDAIYILLTEKAQSDNWLTSEDGMRAKLNGEKEKYIGLKEELKKMDLPCDANIKGIPIEDGKTEEEIWKIFEKMYDLIKDDLEDELYIDITHGFRYIPMLMLVFSNYTKFLNQFKIKSITYGNFETRIGNIAPIIDVTALSSLQDWTSASDQFLSTGSVEKLSNVYYPQLIQKLRESGGDDHDAQIMRTFIDTLKKVVKELNTCQGKLLIEAKSINTLKSKLENVISAEKPKPFKPLLDKISHAFDEFSSSKNVMNGFAAARWCSDNGLYQQAITFLQETIISSICEKINVDWSILGNRDLVSSALNILKYKIENEEEKWSMSKAASSIENSHDIIRNIIKLPEVEEIKNTFSLLSDIRNEFLHAAMLSNKQFSPEDIQKRIKENTEKICNLLLNNKHE